MQFAATQSMFEDVPGHAVFRRAAGIEELQQRRRPGRRMRVLRPPPVSVAEACGGRKKQLLSPAVVFRRANRSRFPALVLIRHGGARRTRSQGGRDAHIQTA